MNTRVVNLTSSGAIITGEGILTGMYVNSTSSGAFKLYHGTEAVDTGSVLTGTITPAVGSHNLFNLHATAGVWLEGSAGSFNISFFILEAN